MLDDEQLSVKELEVIQTGLSALYEGRISFVRPKWIKRSIAKRSPRLRKALSLSTQVAYSCREGSSLYTTAKKAPRERAWDIGMSDEFVKDIEVIDGKLRGQVLKAMVHISKEPVTLRGDTVKPLVSDLKGLWRYRIGDFRLVYRPDSENKRVVCLTFGSRGEIYH